MVKPTHVFIAGALLLVAAACMTVGPCDNQSVAVSARPAHWAQPVESRELGNFYKVSDELYRSKQPSRDAMREAEKLGIKTVLDLRSGTSADPRYAHGTSLVTVHCSVPYTNVEEETASLIEALRLIRDAKKPVLVHCRHGADRTGLIVALYRITVQNWSNAEAADELVNGGFGHHKRLYPGIAEYVRNLDSSRILEKL